jgi:hypothetical protein
MGRTLSILSLAHRSTSTPEAVPLTHITRSTPSLPECNDRSEIVSNFHKPLKQIERIEDEEQALRHTYWTLPQPRRCTAAAPARTDKHRVTR